MTSHPLVLRARALAGPAAHEAGRALAAAWTAPDRHPLPRLVVTRLAAWSTVLWALLVVAPTILGTAPMETPWEEARLWVTLVTAPLAFALLGRRALWGWRVGAVTAVLWVPGTDAYGVFGWPVTLHLVLGCAYLLVTFRYDREVIWGVWGWSSVVLVAQMGRGGLGWSLAALAVTAVVDASRQRRQAQREAVAEREARAREEEHSQVLEERARIARDLHDVVAHHMSMIAVQAESAQYRLPGLDEAAAAELASIAKAARAALTEVRGILTVLRDGSGAAARAPQPTLDGLDELVEAARTGGADVRLEVSGERRPLVAAVEIAAYRIVQEGLANARRHARGAAVVVHLDYGQLRLEVDVTNAPPPGSALPSPLPAPHEGERVVDLTSAGGERRAGHGLVGMRERATLLGGELTAGPTADGGFRVHAVLPLEVKP